MVTAEERKEIAEEVVQKLLPLLRAMQRDSHAVSLLAALMSAEGSNAPVRSLAGQALSALDILEEERDRRPDVVPLHGETEST